MRSRHIRICLIGWGAIALRLAELLRADRSIHVAAVAARDPARLRAPLPEDSLLITAPDALAGLEIDLVIEAAGPAAVEPWAETGLRHADAVAISSTSALCDDLLLAKLIALAQKHGSQLVIPSGALGSLGILSAASALPLDEVSHAICKPPVAWRGTPAEMLIDLDGLDHPVTFFTGSAREAAAQFPQNANVAVISALAGIGLDNTRLTLTADPGLARNVHRICAVGAFGRFVFEVENEPMTSNPKSSEMTALSLARLVRNRVAALVH